MNSAIVLRMEVVQSAAAAYRKQQGEEANPYLPGSCAYHAWMKHLDTLNSRYPADAHVGAKAQARDHFNTRRQGGNP